MTEIGRSHGQSPGRMQRSIGGNAHKQIAGSIKLVHEAAG